MLSFKPLNCYQLWLSWVNSTWLISYGWVWKGGNERGFVCICLEKKKKRVWERTSWWNWEFGLLWWGESSFVCFRKKGKESAEIGSVNLVKERGGFEVRTWLFVFYMYCFPSRRMQERKMRGSLVASVF